MSVIPHLKATSSLSSEKSKLSMYRRSVTLLIRPLVRQCQKTILQAAKPINSLSPKPLCDLFFCQELLVLNPASGCQFPSSRFNVTLFTGRRMMWRGPRGQIQFTSIEVLLGARGKRRRHCRTRSFSNADQKRRIQYVGCRSPTRDSAKSCTSEGSELDAVGRCWMRRREPSREAWLPSPPKESTFRDRTGEVETCLETGLFGEVLGT